MNTTRRTLLAAAAGTVVARPALAQPKGSNVLRYIPQADVTVLDPLSTTAYPTRNHGYMCWDTLYGIDSRLRTQPRLAEGHVVEDDGKRWMFALRDKVEFHDGEPIRAGDAVASIKRWMPEDTHRQRCLAARMKFARATTASSSCATSARSA